MMALVRGVIAGRIRSGSMLIGAGIDIHEDRCCSHSRNAAGGGEEREWGGDHLVTHADVQGHEAAEQRIGAA